MDAKTHAPKVNFPPPEIPLAKWKEWPFEQTGYTWCGNISLMVTISEEPTCSVCRGRANELPREYWKPVAGRLVRAAAVEPARIEMPAAEWTSPAATLVAFVYDERPCLNLMRSLLRDARRWPNLSIWDKSKDALISRARSDVATMFLEQGSGDVLIMVDHDIGWEAGDLEHLTRVCMELECVVGGVFPKRGFGLGVPIRWGQYGEFVVPSDRVVECSAVATGFFAVHRKVLEAVSRTLPMTSQGYRPFFVQRSVRSDEAERERRREELVERARALQANPKLRQAGMLLGDVARWMEQTSPVDGRWDDISEDYDFCAKARDAGFKVFADLKPQLTHFGSHLFALPDTMWKPPERGSAVTLDAKDPNKPLELKAGFSLYVDQDDQFITSDLIRAGAWEPEVLESLLAQVREGDVVVEVGAHIGVHTVGVARDPRVSKVVAVEPLPHLVELLRRNVELNGLGGKVDVWPMALVHHLDSRRSARMLKDVRNPGASHLLDATEELGLEVPTARLAEVAERIDILKIDAEGAEFLILEGERAAAALKDCRVIVTEYCDAQLRRVSGVTGLEYLDLLEELGFDTGVAEEDRGKLPVGQAYCNIVAVRRGSAECSVPGARESEAAA